MNKKLTIIIFVSCFLGIFSGRITSYFFDQKKEKDSPPLEVKVPEQKEKGKENKKENKGANPQNSNRKKKKVKISKESLILLLRRGIISIEEATKIYENGLEIEKEEEEPVEKKKKGEENGFLDFFLSWLGIMFLLIAIVTTIFITFTIFFCCETEKNNVKNDIKKYLLNSTLINAFLYLIVIPFLLAMIKTKEKGYFNRFEKIFLNNLETLPLFIFFIMCVFCEQCWKGENGGIIIVFSTIYIFCECCWRVRNTSQR